MTGPAARLSTRKETLREFKSLAIKFSMPSPTDPAKQTRVLVSLAHIVRLVPYYFVISGGKRMITAVEADEKGSGRQGLQRSFIVYDALGGQYDSGSARTPSPSPLGRMWGETTQPAPPPPHPPPESPG